MQIVTSTILAAFAAYMGAWYLGAIEGDLGQLLFLATLVTGTYWMAETVVFLPRRQRAADALAAAGPGMAHNRAALLQRPWWLDWAGLFPAIALLFVLRSFVLEPFKIPSGSMNPTLVAGDLILVNKFAYGVRLPVGDARLFEGTPPQRGDVVVFRYPPRPSEDYVKRIVGLPGDEVAYLGKRLTINGERVPVHDVGVFLDRRTARPLRQSEEQLGTHTHRVLEDDRRPATIRGASDFAPYDHCRYSTEGVVCQVPPGQYFVMGDNRDNSRDSRYWGFVPEEDIVGKAFLTWMNLESPRAPGAIE
ncbi:MAG: signal peptidase I [Pseudomonadota bacterium]